MLHINVWNLDKTFFCFDKKKMPENYQNRERFRFGLLLTVVDRFKSGLAHTPIRAHFFIVWFIVGTSVRCSNTGTDARDIKIYLLEHWLSWKRWTHEIKRKKSGFSKVNDDIQSPFFSPVNFKLWLPIWSWIRIIPQLRPWKLNEDTRTAKENQSLSSNCT